MPCAGHPLFISFAGGGIYLCAAALVTQPCATPLPAALWCALRHDSVHQAPQTAKTSRLLCSFWQLGAVKYLRTRYDLTQLPMAGVSSGSLVACLSACNVDPQLMVDGAYQLAVDNDIWNRRTHILCLC
jgi:hypothetical protein